MHTTEIFGRYAEQYQKQTLPEEVIHHAKRAVIDWYASLLPGLACEPLAQLEQVLAPDLDHGSATLGTGRVATLRAAALFNGTAAHAAEIDDSFRDAMYHPGAATVAAALAASQHAGSTGLEFLRALVLGYEVSTRIGVVMGRPHYAYWHSTGTVGSFGAAAAAATAMGLAGRPFAHALATVATFAAGLQQAFRMDSMSKPLHAGRAAEAGVLAAQLAAGGVTGSLDVIDGQAGFGQAMSDGPDWSTVAATLGEEFHITRLTFKNHVGCGHVFAAIDAALTLRHSHGLNSQDIESIQVGTYKTALDIACYARPESANEARFSIPYLIATAFVRGRVRLSAYEPEGLADAQVRALMERVDVHVDPACEAAFPGQRSARVRVVTRAGKTLEYTQPNRKGDPELPLSDAELDDKFLELATPVLGASEAQAMLARLWALDTAPSV